jgi:hypothetical protein
MTVTTAWVIQGMTIDSGSVVFENFTTRTQGLSIRQQAQVGRFGTSHGQLQLDNQDNALTPGGGGSLQNYDWFNAVYKFKVQSTLGGSTLESDVCFMVCTDIRFDDDGTRSVAILTLADPFIYAARDQVTGISLSSPVYDSLDEIMLDIVNGYSSGGDTITAVAFPRFAAAADSQMSIERGNNDITVASPADDKDIGYTGKLQSLESGSARDYINNQVLPTGPSIAFPANVSTSGSGASTKFDFNAFYINRKLTREEVGGNDKFKKYVFNENGSAGVYPVMFASTQFNSAEVSNQATVQDQGASGDAVVSNNTTSQQGLGVRSVNYLNVILPQTTPSQTAKTNVADWWTTRYDTVSFVTQQITTSIAAIEPHIDTSSQNTNFTDLLSGDDCLWTYAEVTLTPTGGSSAKTYKCVIVGRQIEATPSDTKITFDLVSAIDNQSIKLDNTDIGLLDTFRVG